MDFLLLIQPPPGTFLPFSDAMLRSSIQSEVSRSEPEGGFHSTFRAPYASAHGRRSISFRLQDEGRRMKRTQAYPRMGEVTSGQHMSRLHTAWVPVYAPQGGRRHRRDFQGSHGGDAGNAGRCDTSRAVSSVPRSFLRFYLGACQEGAAYMNLISNTSLDS